MAPRPRWPQTISPASISSAISSIVLATDSLACATGDQLTKLAARAKEAEDRAATHRYAVLDATLARMEADDLAASGASS